MVNLVYIVWGRSSYVTWLGWNCCMSTWMATERYAKDAHLSKMRYIRRVLRIELIDPKMHGARSRGAGNRTRRGFHSPRDKARGIRKRGGGSHRLEEGRVDGNSPVEKM